MEQDPYDFALDDNSDSSDSDESYVKPLTVPPVERKLAHVNILDKAKALLEKRNVGGLNAKSSASSSSSSLASTSQESEIAQDGNAYEDVKKTITIPQVDDESEDYSEDEEEETSLESGIESDIEFPDIEEAQERAEAKPPCSFGKEEKRAQAKRQRAARESAVREAFVESPKTIDFATQYYVEFSVCLGSVPLRNLDANTRDSFVAQIAGTLGVIRKAVSIQGAREDFKSGGCVLETRVGVRDGMVARALGSVLAARAPPLLASDLFSNTRYTSTIIVFDGESSTRFQFAASSESRDAATHKPEKVSTSENSEDDDGPSREVATQICGNHAGTQTSLHAPGFDDATSSGTPTPVASEVRGDASSGGARVDQTRTEQSEARASSTTPSSSRSRKDLCQGLTADLNSQQTHCWDPWSFYGCFPQAPTQYGGTHPMLSCNPFFLQRSAQLEILARAHARLAMLSSPEKEASIECGEDDSASREGENDSSRPSRENSVAMFRLMKNQDELYRRQLDGIRQRIALQRVKTAKARRTN